MCPAFIVQHMSAGPYGDREIQLPDTTLRAIIDTQLPLQVLPNLIC